VHCPTCFSLSTTLIGLTYQTQISRVTTVLDKFSQLISFKAKLASVTFSWARPLSSEREHLCCPLSPLPRHTLLFLLINLLEAKMSFRGFGSQGGRGGQSSQGDRGRGGRGGPGGPGGRGRGASGTCRTW